MGKLEAKQIFEIYSDKNGWIIKEPNEIADEYETDAIERIELLKDLWSYYNLFDKEFKNKKWRFK